MIVADSFRRDHLGAYGNSTIRTPHLDRLAASPFVYDQHRISSFPTMPARADFLTGRFSFTFMGWEPLPPELDTLPAMLSRAGYLDGCRRHALLHQGRLWLRPRLRRLHL